MLLADLVATSAAVAGTRSRLAKVAALADLLAALAPGEIRPAVGFLIGDPSQGRVGIGWATLRDLDAGPAPDPTLTVADIDALIDGVRAATGSGSAAARRRILTDAFARATEAEADFLRRLLLGELRPGRAGGDHDRRDSRAPRTSRSRSSAAPRC